MRCQQLLLPSALLSQAICSSVAFQVPHRNIIAPTRGTKFGPLIAAAAAPIDGPLSRLGQLLKVTASKRRRAISAETDTKSNRRILALAMTCCLACLVRPGAARAAAIARPSGAGASAFAALLVDPATSVYAVGQIELAMCALVLDLLRRASLLFLMSVPLAAALSLARAAGDGSARWMALFADCHCCQLGIGGDDRPAPELKREVRHPRSSRQIEQSIHRATSRAPKLHNSKDPTSDELKEFDRIARRYEMTIEESLTFTDLTNLKVCIR